MRLLNKILLNSLVLVFVITALYYFYLTDSIISDKNLWKSNENKNVNIFSAVNNKNSNITINIWCIFTKVTENVPLQYKFKNLLKSLFTFSSVPLNIHLICDNTSKIIANKILNETKIQSKYVIHYFFYDVQICSQKINDIVQVMMPYFSSQPGTYYSDALFYLSLGLHRIASINQTRAIMLDCDVYFINDVLLLYNEFNSFKPSNLFGLSYELTPVYRHVLYSYRKEHNTSFGDYVHSNPVVSSGSHIYGFPGFNSGVMLFDLKSIRNSKIYSNVISQKNVKRLVEKYKFKGHLGDQDLYTILGYEYPFLFKILPCNFNRQLCVWWRDHGYKDVFMNYSKCDNDVIIYHGNCNTAIPVLK